MAKGALNRSGSLSCLHRTAGSRREVTVSLKVGDVMLVDEIGPAIFSVSRLVL